MFKKLVLALTYASFAGSSVLAHNSFEIDEAIKKAKNKEIGEKAENLTCRLGEKADCLVVLNGFVASLATAVSIIHYVDTKKMHVGLALVALYRIYNTYQNNTITNKFLNYAAMYQLYDIHLYKLTLNK